MASALATFAVLLGLLGSPGEPPCPVGLPDAGTRLTTVELERLEEELVRAGPGQCGSSLLDWMAVERSPLALRGAGSVLVLWGEADLLPPLYDLFAVSMLTPRGSRYDTAGAAAEAIRGLTGDDEALLDPLRSGAHTRRWVQLARTRYLEEWASAPYLADGSAPTVSEEWLVAAGARFEACVAAPERAPADPFDPLGLVPGPAPLLAVGTRCASAAVLDTWRAGDDAWAPFVDETVAQFAGQGGFVELAAALEQGWAQGASGPAWQPETGPWTEVDQRAPPVALVLLLLVLALAAAWLVLERRGVVGRVARFRLLAVAFGLGSIVALEGVLVVLGAPPGDEYRPVVPVSPLPGSEGPVVSDGRGVSVELPRPPGRVRLVVVGASTVVGIALAWEDTIPARLAAMLEDDVPCLEVLNQGRMGYASPGMRALTLEAVDDLDADAVVLYTGHNEVTDMRELGRYVDIHPGRLPLRAAVTRTRLVGVLHRLLRPGPRIDDEVDHLRRQEVPFDFHAFNPDFERRVTARFERELTDIARATERRGAGLALVLPSFNHHGLLVEWFDVQAPFVDVESSNFAAGVATVDRLVEELRTGRGAEAVRLAEAIQASAPGHPTPRCLEALARELVGDFDGAEAAVWECARRNHAASSITPGVASAIARVARRHDLPLADAHGALHRAAGAHLPGYDLHIDSVHLNPRGTDAVAREIAATIRSAGWLEQWRGVCGEGAP